MRAPSTGGHRSDLLLDTNAISDFLRAAPRIENFTIVPARYCSGLQDFREADGVRSWMALALGATLVSRYRDFGDMDGLRVVALE
jgi:predicted nucleic acid-binding protein